MYSNNSGFPHESTQAGPSDNLRFERRPVNPKRWCKRWWGRIIVVFLTFFLIIFFALSIYIIKVVYLLRSGQITSQQLFGDSFSEERFDEPSGLVDENDPFLGPADAGVVIVEFSDFQCSASGLVYPVIKQLIRDYGKDVKLVYKDFPAVGSHPQALLAALAGQCAREQGEFWPMHDNIFEDQDNITESQLKTYAVRIGLNSLQFGTCLESDKYLAEIESDLEKGLEIGVDATPTFFVNGTKVRGAATYEAFQKLIISELNK